MVVVITEGVSLVGACEDDGMAVHHNRVDELLCELLGVQFSEQGLAYQTAWMGFPGVGDRHLSPMEMLDGLMEQSVPTMDAVKMIELYRLCIDYDAVLMRQIQLSRLRVEKPVVAVQPLDDAASCVSCSSTDSVASARSIRKQERRSDYLVEAVGKTQESGYCYLELVHVQHRVAVANKLGVYPTLLEVFSMSPHVFDLDAWNRLDMREVRGCYHVFPGDGMLTDRVLKTLASEGLVGGLLFRLSLERDSGLADVALLNLELVCGARTPLSPVVEVHGAESLFNLSAGPDEIDRNFLLTRDYDDVVAVDVDIVRDYSTIEPEIVTEWPVGKSFTGLLATGTTYSISSEGDSSVSVAHFPAGSKIVVGDQICAVDHDAFVWVWSDKPFVFRVSGLGRNLVSCYHFPVDLLMYPVKDMLWRKFHGMAHALYRRKSLPQDAAKLVSVRTSSDVEKSMFEQHGHDRDYNGVVMVLSDKFVSYAGRMYPKARIRTLRLTIAQQYDRAMLLLLPSVVDGDALWYKSDKFSSWLDVGGSLEFPRWTRQQLFVAVSRHTEVLMFAGFGRDREFVNLLRHHGMSLLSSGDGSVFDDGSSGGVDTSGVD